MGTDIHGVFQRKTKNGWEDIPSNYEQDRYYLLFAWLGNVRNGYGFAGVPTHTAVTPLSDNRGIPDDFDMDGECHFDTWMGDHSHSWLTADEILSTRPPTDVLRTGVVSVDWFRQWDGITSPEAWSGNIHGEGILVSSPSEVTEKTTHVQIEWFENTSDTLKYFIDEVARLKNEYGEVRLVFGFDS